MLTQPPIVRLNQILLAGALGRCHLFDPVFLGEGGNPLSVGSGPAGEGGTVDHGKTSHIVEEVDDVVRTLEGGVVASDDDPVGAAVGKADLLGEQLR